MTGYGRARGDAHGWTVDVELHSVNNKAFKLSPRLGEELYSLLPEIEALLKSRIERGTVYVTVGCARPGGRLTHEVDAEVLAAYFHEIQNAARKVGIMAPLNMDTLIGLPGVIRPRQGVEDREGMWEAIESVLADGLGKLAAMREREGEALRAVLGAHVDTVRATLQTVRGLVPAAAEAYRERLQSRIEQLFAGSGAGLSREEVLKEVVMFADRSDITEELARLESHLVQVSALFDKDGSVGRELEFLGQEMFREANTMVSKTADSALMQHVLAIKSEIDKFREQVRNVE